MKKVLLLASVASIIKQFNMSNINVLQKLGCEVHVAANFSEGNTISNEAVEEFRNVLSAIDVKAYDVDFYRDIKNKRNFHVYKRLREILKKENYNLIHCHSPIGGVLTRLAVRGRIKKDTKIIYTAHGFHFYKGAPLKNWILYYSTEKLLSRNTDCLITINKEDYNRAKNRNFKAGEIVHIKGIGIDLNEFRPRTEKEKQMLRREYGYDSRDFILIYAGELSPRKNQEILIKAAAEIKNYIPELKLLFAGIGPLEDEYRRRIAELGLEDTVLLLGYRKDIKNLMMLSDAAVTSSRQEGLPVNVMEAMATGLPVIASDCRGNNDLIEDRVNGFLVDAVSPESFTAAIRELYDSETLRKNCSIKALEKIDEYSSETINCDMKKIYLRYLNNYSYSDNN